MPRAIRACGLPGTSTSLPRASVPVCARMPASTSTSWACPLPSIPATPTISLAPIAKVASRNPPSVVPIARATNRSRTAARSRAGSAGSSPPTIARASTSVVVCAASARSVTRPARKTVTRSACAKTSARLCVMMRIAVPARASARNVAKSVSASPGERAAVGSSRTSTLGSDPSTRKISTRCTIPIASVSTTASGSTCNPVRVARSRTRVRAARASSRMPRCGSRPSTMFSHTRSRPASSKC